VGTNPTLIINRMDSSRIPHFAVAHQPLDSVEAMSKIYFKRAEDWRLRREDGIQANNRN